MRPFTLIRTVTAKFEVDYEFFVNTNADGKASGLSMYISASRIDPIGILDRFCSENSILLRDCITGLPVDLETKKCDFFDDSFGFKIAIFDISGFVALNPDEKACREIVDSIFQDGLSPRMELTCCSIADEDTPGTLKIEMYHDICCDFRRCCKLRWISSDAKTMDAYNRDVSGQVMGRYYLAGDEDIIREFQTSLFFYEESKEVLVDVIEQFVGQRTLSRLSYGISHESEAKLPALGGSKGRHPKLVVQPARYIR
jgi:hypothetical protein